MSTRLQALLITLLLAGPAWGQPASRPATALDDWPRWRGPLDSGTAPRADPPLEWDEKRNVRWKVALPGRGHSTPIVWGNRVFITTAIPGGEPRIPERDLAPGAHDNLRRVRRQESVVLALDRTTGRVIWRRTVHSGLPHEGGHISASQASASPVTDGEVLVASFGSRGLFGLDMAGSILWRVKPGKLLTKHAHGEGSSPTLFGDTVVLNCDHEGQSFIAAYDKRTGKQRWRRERDEVTSWATPVVTRVDGRAQVVVSGTGRVRGYDLATGAVVWQCGGLSHNVVASPIAAGGVVYAASSYEKQAMLAIRVTGARGELSGSKHVLWYRRRGTPYVPSPLLYEGTLYLLHHYQGVLSLVDAATGQDRTRSFRMRVLRNIYASPVAAAGRVYITDRDGVTLVLSSGRQPKVLAVNRLDEGVSASAALAGKEIFLRGDRHLYCLGRP